MHGLTEVTDGAQQFEEYCARKTREALAASLHHLTTEEDTSQRFPVRPIGNEWTRRLYDGFFHVFEPPPATPAVSLVFVQSREGNTAADDPAELGGGPTDKHLIYEGLTRVAADAVLAGAKTISGEMFFSVWHPELVALRAELGLPRHPAQIVVTGRGAIDVRGTLLFNVPDARVFLIASLEARRALEPSIRQRPWISILDLANDPRQPLEQLRRTWNIRRISLVGGRTTATRFIDAELVQDMCLTTTSKSAGQPGTPFYSGSDPPKLERLVRKRSDQPDAPFVFDHFAVSPRH